MGRMKNKAFVSGTKEMSQNKLFGAAIIGLGVQEIKEMIEEDGQAEAQCHFCLEKYNFNKEELQGFINEIQS